jgi:hypothetical protein
MRKRAEVIGQSSGEEYLASERLGGGHVGEQLRIVKYFFECGVHFVRCSSNHALADSPQQLPLPAFVGKSGRQVGVLSVVHP